MLGAEDFISKEDGRRIVHRELSRSIFVKIRAQLSSQIFSFFGTGRLQFRAGSLSLSAAEAIRRRSLLSSLGSHRTAVAPLLSLSRTAPPPPLLSSLGSHRTSAAAPLLSSLLSEGHIQSTIDVEILQVVMPQSGGSNRLGFRLVFSNSRKEIYLDGVFNIISYDVVPKLSETLLKCHFKMVIADESHFLKNAQAKRTTAAVPILKKAEHAILLSGTPALSRPIELFKQLEALYPEVYKNVHEYGNRYCKGGHFGMYQGASNHDELHNLMKATVMIRRMKKDVLTELPMKRRQQVFLELNEKDMKQIRALFRELEAVKLSIESSDSEEKIASLKLTQRSLINKIYINSAEAKIPSVLDYLGTVIEVSSVNIYYLLANDTVDDIIWDVVQSKLENLGQMLDGQEKTLDVSIGQTSNFGRAVNSGKTSGSPLKANVDKTLRSPSRQGTLDSFLKRCHSPDTKEDHPKVKNPRF